MNKKLFCILITLLFFLCNINIIFSEPKKDEWIKISTGITGGIIKGFVQSKQDKNLLYCATFGKGVYKSENYGRLWKSFSKGLDSLHLLSIAIHPKNDQVLLVGTSGFGIYKTIDGGIHWEQSRIGLDHGAINYLLFDPDVHHYVYAFTKDGMYKSYDEGATWIYVPTDFMQNLVNFFHVSPLNPKKFFVCARDMGFYYSENKGENWKKVSDNDHMKEVTSVAEDPDNKLILYIGTLRDGILKYRYDEFKKVWNEEHFGLSIFHVTSILINPLNHDEILASTFGDGLFHSLDKGKNWNKIEEGPGSTDIQFLYQDGFNTPIIWAATHSMGIWQSNNRGINWVERNTNLDGLVMNGIISDVNDPSILYAYTFGNVFKSLSKGIEWTRVTDGLPNSDIKCLVIDPDDSNTIYVGTDGSGAYRSLNGAKTWASINSGLNHKRIFALAVNPKNSKHIIAGSYGKGIFQTDDGGRTWKSTNDGIKDAFVVSVIFHPSEIDTIFVGSSNTGAFKSTDNGNHWTPINSGLETKNIISLIMNPGYPNILYCGTEAYKAFKSVNGGLNWELMDQGLNQTYSRHFAVHPEYPNIVYCSGNQGIFYSANRGIYWNSLNNGLEKNAGLNIYDANMISIPIDDPTTLFVATYMGVYQYEMTDLPDIDIDAPIIELENKQNPITVKEPFIEIKGNVSDKYTGISTFEVNKRQIKLSPDGMFNVTINLNLGANMIILTAIDKAGNVNELFLNVIFDDGADKIPPNISIDYPVDESTVTTTPILVKGRVTDEKSGVQLLKINNRNIQIDENGFFKDMLEILPGENKITFYALDNFGNETIEKRTVYYIQADTTPPIIDIFSPNEDTPLIEKKAIIVGRVTDPERSIQDLFINNQPVKMDKLGNFSFTMLLEKGENTIVIIAINSDGLKAEKKLTLIYEPKEIKVELYIGNTLAFINGKRNILDAPPFIFNGRTVVPLRFIGEAFGAKIDWNPTIRTITLDFIKKDIQLVLTIDDPIAYINGKKITLEVPPMIKNGRTFVPLRFIGEATGCSIEWEGKEQKITLSYSE